MTWHDSQIMSQSHIRYRSICGASPLIPLFIIPKEEEERQRQEIHWSSCHCIQDTEKESERGKEREREGKIAEKIAQGKEGHRKHKMQLLLLHPFNKSTLLGVTKFNLPQRLSEREEKILLSE